ncbi:MAG: hypothetical protein KJ047_08535 [Anaerolineae bacterium]|nr:hypothetical protein [Anaerolineae bacterium]
MIISQFATDAIGNFWAGTPDGWLPLSQEGRALAEVIDVRAATGVWDSAKRRRPTTRTCCA